MADLRPFWVSWWHDVEGERSGFELHCPWWVSGSRDDDDAQSIVAAVMALDEDDAKARIVAAHDHTDVTLEWRFVNPRDPGWEPFCNRFPRAEWMRWPYPTEVPHG